MTAETALGTMLWKMHAWQIDPFYFWCGWTCQHGLSAKTKNCFSAFFMWNVAEQCFVNGFNANLCTSLVSILLCLQLPFIIRLTKVVFESITRWLCTGPLSQLTIWPHYQTISTDVVSNFIQISFCPHYLKLLVWFQVWQIFLTEYQNMTSLMTHVHRFHWIEKRFTELSLCSFWEFGSLYFRLKTIMRKEVIWNICV